MDFATTIRLRCRLDIRNKTRQPVFLLILQAIRQKIEEDLFSCKVRIWAICPRIVTRINGMGYKTSGKEKTPFGEWRWQHARSNSIFVWFFETKIEALWLWLVATSTRTSGVAWAVARTPGTFFGSFDYWSLQTEEVRVNDSHVLYRLIK